MNRRGFTLVELMLASTLALVVLAGTFTVGVQLQKRALMEQQTTTLQGSAQTVVEFVLPQLQRAGEGMGNARINLGGTSTAYAVRVTTDDPFTGDPSFSLPPPQYAGLASDSLQIRWADPTTVVSMTACDLSGADGGTGTAQWRANAACTSVLATGFPPGTDLFAINASLPEACQQRVTAAPQPAVPGVKAALLPVQPSPSSANPIAPDLCVTPDGGVWGTPGSVLMGAGGISMRVNWANGSPVLESISHAPPLPGDAWTEVSSEVEQLKVLLGVADLTADGGSITTFPSTDGGIYAVDRCTGLTTPTPGCPVPGGMVADPTRDPTVYDALMRRVRSVEVQLVTRAARRDLDALVAIDGGLFTLDRDGNPADGFRRRRLSVGITPRNLAIAGSF